MWYSLGPRKSDAPSIRERIAKALLSAVKAKTIPATLITPFLARQMDRLAQLVRWTGAATPEDHEGRMDVWDAEIAERQFDRGYAEGREAGSVRIIERRSNNNGSNARLVSGMSRCVVQYLCHFSEFLQHSLEFFLQVAEVACPRQSLDTGV